MQNSFILLIFNILCYFFYPDNLIFFLSLLHNIPHFLMRLPWGSNHSIYKNTETNAWTAIPRHPNIEERTVFRICKQLGIPKP